MICAHCGESTPDAPCTACGAEPRLDGRYALVAELGRGAQGTTFRAIGPDGGVVAVKELPVGRAADDKALARLEREAAVLRELRHPAIPMLHETFFAGSGRARSLYVVQELVEGEDLEAWIMGHRTSEVEVVGLMRQLCDVLEWLHTRSPPVVHRDLKPANIIRRPDGTLALVDFGSVRAAVRDPLAGGSTVAGTFGYMAPEQLLGDASPRSDLFSLGAVAVRLLTRKPPAELVDRTGRIDWRPHAAINEGVAVLLDDLLSLDPDDRPASAAAVRTRLDAPESATQLPAVRPAAPVATPPDAEQVGALLSESLGSPGRLVPSGSGWRWVSLHGRVEVDLRETPGGIVATPHVASGLASAAAAMAVLVTAATTGGTAWAYAAGHLPPDKAMALAFVATMMSTALAVGPVFGWLTRQRLVRGALRAAGIGVGATASPGAPRLVRRLRGPASEAKARRIGAAFEEELGVLGEVKLAGDGWKWRTSEGSRRVRVHVADRGGDTRVAMREEHGALVGGLIGGVSGVAGALGGGFAWWFFLQSLEAGFLWLGVTVLVPMLLGGVGVVAGIRRRRRQLSGVLDAIESRVDED